MRFLRLVLSGVVCLCILTFGVQSSFASDDSIAEMQKEIQLLKDRIAQLEKKLNQECKEVAEQKDKIAVQEKELKTFQTKFEQSYDASMFQQGGKPIYEIHGLKVGVNGTFIGQGANNANLYGSSKETKMDGSLQGNVEFEKVFTDIDGRGYANLRAGPGEGADRFLVLYSDADNNKTVDPHAHFTSLYYVQNLFDKKAVVSFGNIDPTDFFDANRLAGSDSTQFLGSIFNNNPAIEFPDPSLALRAGISPIDLIELTGILVNTNSEWQDIDDNVFAMAELTFKPKFFDREGYYRLMAWHNNANHIKWDTTDTGKGTYGFALSFDQDITDIISLFTRYGWENPDVYNPDVTATGDNILSLEQSWSFGIQLNGNLWGRENDFAGFAFGQVIPSDDYKKALGRKGEHEGHLELYYNLYVNKYIAISPDFQYIIDPYGGDVTDNDDPIFIFGVRTTMQY